MISDMIPTGDVNSALWKSSGRLTAGVYRRNT